MFTSMLYYNQDKGKANNKGEITMTNIARNDYRRIKENIKEIVKKSKYIEITYDSYSTRLDITATKEIKAYKELIEYLSIEFDFIEIEDTMAEQYGKETWFRSYDDLKDYYEDELPEDFEFVEILVTLK